MSRSSFDERRKGLEEEFFAKQNRELAEKLKSSQKREEGIRELARVSGIGDEAILGSLFDAHITPTELAALSLAPLVLVAWADGKLDIKERKAIERAIQEQGIAEDDMAYKLLLNWMQEPPEERLIQTWKQYMDGLGKTLDKPTFERLHKRIVQRAHEVAEASGGYMGLGDPISDAERDILNQLKETA